MARGDPPLPRRHRVPLRRLNRPRAGGKSPAHGAGSRHRCGRRAAACAGACREYGEPPGALRLTVPTSQEPCSAGCPPASMGVWPSARARCVPAPEGTTAHRRRLHVPCVAGTGVPSREARAGSGHRLAGEETAPLQVDRETRRNPVHAVSFSWPVGACGSRSGCPRGSPSTGRILIKFSLQHKYFCKLRCKTSVT